MWEAKDCAVWNELERLKDIVHEHPPATIVVNTSARVASSASGGSAFDNTARAVHASKFYDGVARIQREMDEEDAVIVTPSRVERLLASRTQAYDRGDYNAVQCAGKLIEKSQARRRPARARKKERKDEVCNYIAEFEKDRTADPPYNNDRSYLDSHIPFHRYSLFQLVHGQRSLLLSY